MDLLYFFLGISAGVFAGIVPGVGIFTVLVICYPILLDANIWQVVSFYVPLGVISQFVGSVPALYFKIPGESTSLVATEHGHKLFKQGHTDLIPLTAIGSLFASIICACFFIMFWFVDPSFLAQGLTSTVGFVAICVSLIVLVLSSSNSYSFSTLQIFAGILLGLVGFNINTGTEFLTFDNEYLSLGIPLYPMIVGFYIIPNIINLTTQDNEIVNIKQYLKVLTNLKNHIKNFFVGSFIGSVCGFIPIAGKIIGVNVSRMITPDDKQKVVLAETSNNASIGTAMIPLFAFGIPITLGEFLVLDLVESKYYNLSEVFINILTSSYLPLLFVFSGIAGLIISWPFAKYLLYFYKIPLLLLKASLLVLTLFSIFLIGISSSLIWYYCLIIAVFLPFGLILIKKDPIPFIFSFVLADYLYNIVFRYYTIYS